MRKYDKYVIEIIHLNGNKQIRKADNPESYNETISLYHTIKEETYNDNITINVIGISDEERGIIFSKKNSSTDNQQKDIKEMIDVLYETSLELQKRLNNVKDMVDLTNKRRSNLEHLLIEAIDAETLTEGEKVKIFDEMRETVLTRRDYKILDSIRLSTKNDLSLIINKTKSISRTYDQCIKVSSNIIDELINNEDSKLKETHLVKEYEYKNHKERINLMKQLQGKYDKIVNLEDKNTLACYNKCTA